MLNLERDWLGLNVLDLDISKPRSLTLDTPGCIAHRNSDKIIQYL